MDPTQPQPQQPITPEFQQIPPEPVMSPPPAVINSPSTPPGAHEVPTKKHSSFLVTFLSILLLIAVAAAGFFAWQTQNLAKQLQGIINSPEPTTLSVVEPTPSPDPRANWKTFTDSNNKISFRYPENWQIAPSEGPRILSLVTDQNKVFFVTYHEDVENVNTWLTSNSAGKIVDTKTIGINNFNVVKGGLQSTSREYHLLTSNNLIRFVIEPINENEITLVDQMFQNILSTLDLNIVSPSPTSNSLP